MKLNIMFVSILLISPVCCALPQQEVKHPDIKLTHIISDYRKQIASLPLPLNYSLLEKKQLSDVILQKYELNSQTWSPQGIVSPQEWQHEVDIYIPDAPENKHALVVINNGTNYPGPGIPSTDISPEALARIAHSTETIVISVSNIPNQYLTYQGNPTPLAEDNSVAYTWKLFMNNTEKYQSLPLHIPMSAAISQTFRLAKKELAEWNIDKFIVTGASKRGWISWLTALSDPDVDAIVPFVMDLLDTKNLLEHMYHSYGMNWPIAFYPYYAEGIDQKINTDEFAELMTLEDPLTYLGTDLGPRLNIEKYIINASGDDFFPPDGSWYYYDKLPGVKSLRVVPNSGHKGILSVAEQTLISFVNRFQHQQKLPEIKADIQGEGSKKRLVVNFSEVPVRLVQWTAQNPVARDFRYACDVRYVGSSVKLPSGSQSVNILLNTPEAGWQATYLEATFDDGYIATTQVYITPDDKYPVIAPPSLGPACQTLPGRSVN